jgi:CubicO group peptidase (beta-lactamase class C family)
MDSDHVAGAVVSIVQNGRVSLLKGYGIADTAPVRAVDPVNTLFRIGSLSKTFTWILLMREVERGRVKLEAPINEYLPPELKVSDQGFKQPIRVIDLLSHAPGFEDTALGHLFTDKPEAILPLETYMARHRPDRVREPGQFSTYSNYGTALAGVIVSRLNGVDYETLVERDIFKPLGLASTTFREPYPARAGLPAPMSPELAKRLSKGFTWNGAYLKPNGVEYITSVGPAGAVSTNAADMARYMLLLLNNGRLGDATIYGSDTAKAFRTPVMKTPETVNGWTHGFMESTLPGGFKGYGHGGATQYFMTYMTVIPELDLGIFISTNTPPGALLTDRLTRVVVDRFYARSAPSYATAKPGMIKDPQNYVGPFVSTRRAYSGLEKFFMLVTGGVNVAVSPDGYLMTNAGGQSRAWVPTGRPGEFRAPQGDAKLTFALDENGRAVSAADPYNTSQLQRVGPLMDVRVLATLAGLALFTALWMLPTRFKRLRSKHYATATARRVDQVGFATSLLWIAAFVGAGVWVATMDPERFLYEFPGALVIVSVLSLLAALATIGLMLVTYLVWRDRADWPLRKALQHTVAAVLFGAFAIWLANWGLLSPWA